MDRREFIKKATMAAGGVAVVSPVSAMLNQVSGKTPKVLLINGSPRTDGNTFCCLKKIHADGNPGYPEREPWQAMNFIR